MFMTAFERIADITLPLFTDDLRPQWGPDPDAARGKIAFPRISNDSVCHAASIVKGTFLKFVLENIRNESSLNVRYALNSGYWDGRVLKVR